MKEILRKQNIILKMSDSLEYKRNIQELIRQKKIKLSFYNNVNGIGQWNYKKIK